MIVRQISHWANSETRLHLGDQSLFLYTNSNSTYRRVNGHEFEQASGAGDGQGSLACGNPWGCKELDTTERQNWTELNWNSTLMSHMFLERTFSAKEWVVYVKLHPSPWACIFFYQSSCSIIFLYIKLSWAQTMSYLLFFFFTAGKEPATK